MLPALDPILFLLRADIWSSEDESQTHGSSAHAILLQDLNSATCPSLFSSLLLLLLLIHALLSLGLVALPALLQVVLPDKLLVETTLTKFPLHELCVDTTPRPLMDGCFGETVPKGARTFR